MSLVKLLFVISFLIINVIQAHANAIDRIKTGDDVVTFLHDKIDTFWTDWNVFGEFTEFDKIKKSAKESLKDSFIKIDLDNNGLTDLIVNGRYLFIVIAKGNGKYELSFIDQGTFLSQGYVLCNILYENDQPLLVIREGTIVLDNEHKRMDSTDIYVHMPGKFARQNGYDTLIVKFGRLLEFNPKPNYSQIEEINFSTTECYGTCPVYTLSIKNDRSAIYHAIQYIKDSGEFAGVISKKNYERFNDIMNYVNIKSLDSSYSVNWTDDQTFYLEIKFKDGNVKKIEDYGRIGTFGLIAIYKQLNQIRKTQKWTRISVN